MGRLLTLYLLTVAWLFPANVTAQKDVQKTNPMKVYMHYMPWFETPETIGKWGWHWTMNTMNPENINDEGQREIASHYYPLIGPYASRDRDVIEYHLLLMKLSGIDGVLIDWYGTVGSNGDIKQLLKSSDSIISYTDDFGMEFGIVLEDRFSRSLDDVKANMAYMRYNYLNRPEYIRIGENDNPLVCIFGPITFESPSDWNEIMPAAGEELEFLPLWYESGEAGSEADGEYSWIYQDDLSHLGHLENFYSTRAPQLEWAMGSAYPGFNDFYAEGGAGSGYFNIPHYYGSTLTETLNKAEEYKENIDMLQLATFNDFGEGTMFEPTVETGFEYLNKVQDYTGVAYGEDELKLVHRLYLHRKGYANDPAIQEQLDSASFYLSNLEIQKAAGILNSIEITGSRDISSQINKGNIQVFPNPSTGGEITIHSLKPGELIHNIKIVDLSGKLLYERGFSTGRTLISLQNINIEKGSYLILAETTSYIQSIKILIL